MQSTASERESECIGKEPCPKCGSSDNLARYDDGHAYCFGFGCDHWEPPTDGKTPDIKPRKKSMAKKLPSLGEVTALPNRGIREKTCEKFKYTRGEYTVDGEKLPAHLVAVPYADGTGVAAIKIRLPNKDFRFVGETKEAGLVGQDRWQANGKKLVITEGEMDMLSVSQVQNDKWPVVSIPNGVDGAEKCIARCMKWVDSFEEVVFMFDMDEVGQQAAQACARLLPLGKAKIAKLVDAKDANELLKADRGAEIIDAIWRAEPYRPDGIVAFGDLRENLLKPPEQGLPWIFDELNEWTYGRRYGEWYAFGAGTGVGKTDFMLQQAVQDMADGHGVGVFFMEQPNDETAKRLAGKYGGKRFHVPDGSWETGELLAAFDAVDNGNCYLYDHFGSSEWDAVKAQIRYLRTCDVRLFFVDHLTAFAAQADDERKALESLTAELSGLCQELGIIVHMVSHLSTPEGTPHEEGGRVMIRHFKGSRSIGYWAHFMFGIERDTQADTPEPACFRCLKDRFTGRATGKKVYLGYEDASGRLYVTDPPQPTKKDRSAFDNEEF